MGVGGGGGGGEGQGQVFLGSMIVHYSCAGDGLNVAIRLTSLCEKHSLVIPSGLGIKGFSV